MPPTKVKNGLLLPLLYLRLPWMPLILFCTVLVLGEWKNAKLYLVLSILTAVVANLFFWGSVVTSVLRHIRLFRMGDAPELRKRMTGTKFGAIPYFILNFALWFLFTFLFFAASRGTIIFTPLPLLFLLPVVDCIFCVAATSIPAIAYALTLKKQGKLTSGKTVGFILALLIFVADLIIVAMMAYQKQLRLEQNE